MAPALVIRVLSWREPILSRFGNRRSAGADRDVGAPGRDGRCVRDGVGRDSVDTLLSCDALGGCRAASGATNGEKDREQEQEESHLGSQSEGAFFPPPEW